MRTLLIKKLATFSMVIIVSILAFTSIAYAAPVHASVDNIHIDERPQPFVDTILSRRDNTPAKPEAEDGAFWHYRRDVEDKSDDGAFWHYRRNVENKAETA
ncbi:hypothetical protein BGZ88_004270 [Linnemannia elongata]|nr:hypothetical protein BGZ88_004270 [Linnemannia elongata]